MEPQNPIVAAVIESPNDGGAIIEEFLQSRSDRDFTAEFVPNNARILEGSSPGQFLNSRAGVNAFAISSIVAVIGLFLLIAYYNSISVNDPNVPWQVSGTSILVVIGIVFGMLVAILSGVMVAVGIRRRAFRKVFEHVRPEDSVVVAKCNSTEQAREFIKHLESKGLNRIRTFSPGVAITEKRARHYH